MIIDGDGRILAQAPSGPGEATVVAPVSLDNIRQQRRRRSGHAMPAHLRSSAYPLQRQEIFRPQIVPPQSSDRSPSIESLEQSIEEAKKRIGW
jgi:hypothetical protein